MRTVEKLSDRKCFNCNNFLKNRQKYFCSKSCGAFYRVHNGTFGSATFTDETIKKMSSSKINNTNKRGTKISKEGIENIRKAKLSDKNIWRGKHHVEKSRLKMSLSAIGNKNGCGKRSEEACKNISIGAKNKMLRDGGIIHLGKHEKDLLDALENVNNIKIKRQHIIDANPDIFIVDGYCKETNTVYEVYEQAHEKKIEKDKERQERIQKILNCNFIILWDN